MRSSVESIPPPVLELPHVAAPHAPVWLPRAKKLALVAAQLAGMAALLWFCLPQSLGGRAGWVLVSGTSMWPHYHTGDLVLVEHQSSYHVGEIVAYRIPKGEPGAGYEVIHRIIGGNPRTGWITKGDNRTNPDLWHPKNSNIVGSALLHIPKAFVLLKFLHTPLLLGLFASFLIFFKIVLGGRNDDEAGEAKEDA